MIRQSNFTQKSNRDFYKGKSFRFIPQWINTGNYFNDDYVQDFVSHNGKLYACIQSNIGIPVTNTDYWYFVMEGQKGETGEQGTLFVPVVQDGILSWTNTGAPTSPVNIKGPKGDTGAVGPNVELRKSGQSVQWKSATAIAWNPLVDLTDLKGDTGPRGPQGLPLEYNWDGTRLGIRIPGTIGYTYVDLKGQTGATGRTGATGSRGIKGEQGEKGSVGPAVQLAVEDGQIKMNRGSGWEPLLDLTLIKGDKGDPGDGIIVERDIQTGNLMFRYSSEPSTAMRVLIYKDEYVGPKGDSIAKMYVGSDGYMYVITNDSTVPYRAGYVRGEKGDDGREIVLQVDPTTGSHLQWKYAGDSFKLWQNLIQINELMNTAVAGIQLHYDQVVHQNADGVDTTYDRITLENWEVSFDEDGNVTYLNKIGNLGNPIEIEDKQFLTDVVYDGVRHALEFTFNTATGQVVIEVPMAPVFTGGNGITVDNTGVIDVFVDPDSDKINGIDILTSTSAGLKVSGLTGLIGSLIKNFELFETPQSGTASKWSYKITTTDGTEYFADFPAMSLLADASYDISTHTLTLKFYDDKTATYHSIPINLTELVEIYGVKPDGGLELTMGDVTYVDGLFGIKEKGVVESMLAVDLQKILHDLTRPVLYADLLNKVTTNQLEPGLLYIITDYQTIYKTNDVLLGTDSSPFPSTVYNICVTALSTSVLDEKAIIIEHPQWEISYNVNHLIPEDKGNIYRLVDEWGNAANYDFYNRRTYVLKDRLAPPDITNTILLNSDVAGVYCFTFSTISTDGTAINYLLSVDSNQQSYVQKNKINDNEVRNLMLPDIDKNVFICIPNDFVNNNFLSSVHNTVFYGGINTNRFFNINDSYFANTTNSNIGYSDNLFINSAIDSTIEYCSGKITGVVQQSYILGTLNSFTNMKVNNVSNSRIFHSYAETGVTSDINMMNISNTLDIKESMISALNTVINKVNVIIDLGVATYLDVDTQTQQVLI